MDEGLLHVPQLTSYVEGSKVVYQILQSDIVIGPWVGEYNILHK